MEFDEIKDIRRKFVEPFSLDAILRYVKHKNCMYNDGYRLNANPKINCLNLPENILEDGLRYLVENGFIQKSKGNLKTDDGSFFLMKDGKSYHEASGEFLFDGGLPRWEFLTLEQAYEVASKATEMRGSYFMYYPSSSHSHITPEVYRLDEALRQGLDAFGIRVDEVSPLVKDVSIGLMHFCPQVDRRVSDIFKGYQAYVVSLLDYESVWSAPVEYQERVFEKTLDCVGFVEDLFPEKQIRFR